MKKYLRLFMILLIIQPCFGQNIPLQSYESYYLKSGTYPDDLTNWWMYNGLEVQGVTNDGENWYFTLTAKSKDNAFLWRIPKSVPLASGQRPNNPEIKRITLNDNDVRELKALNFWHWGDPDHYRYNGVDYILIPIPDRNIACFRAHDLKYINYTALDGNQDYAGWCAIGVNGKLYSSDNHARGIIQYDIDWDKLINTPNDHNVARRTGYYPFQNSSGGEIQLFHMQGGEFSPSGELLYVVCGSAGCLGFGPGEPLPSDGIHVFETVNWKEIQRSTKSAEGNAYFSYTFDNSCTCGATGSQSPEGLTIWDLDDGSAPNISGQLHVIKDHYNERFLGIGCDDAITMQHFSRNIYVDKITGIDPPSNPLTGTKSKPFKTFNQAYNFYPIWNGAQVIIRNGDYNDIGTYSKRIRVISEGGSAVIGKR